MNRSSSPHTKRAIGAKAASFPICSMMIQGSSGSWKTIGTNSRNMQVFMLPAK
ncbi:hypothetical protein [uncultured Dubosiella sp.]|uniref:hypothetical protein n=1 Tax=uncultured Dubosiella sp. TaxID=1937011 RepID=UPI0026186FF1|nr:hypothetical protein [uncultured Dubosiella sp.]